MRTLINVISDHQEKNLERQRNHHDQKNLIEIVMEDTIKDLRKELTKTKEKRSHTEIFRQNIGPLRKIQWFDHQFDSTQMMENQWNHLVNLDLQKHK